MKLAEFSIETEKLAPSAWRVFAIASIAIFMASLDSTILYAGFNNILQSFPNSKASDLSWAMSGYSIVYAAMMIPAGGIADKYGRKKCLCWVPYYLFQHHLHAAYHLVFFG